ncbi:MAG: glycosyltransferase family 39 protein [Candidatus Shapirobacteria bacterium]
MKDLFKKKKKISLALLLFLVVLLIRFQGFNWGGGYFFHPDEGNMARSITQMRVFDLNPRFFAYGQFPLYLAYFSGLLLNFISGGISGTVSYVQAVYLLRFFSALFSLAAIYLAYFLVDSLFEKERQKMNWLLIPLLAFVPGLIQSAHFGTTESLLTFICLGLVYLSLLIFQNGFKNKYVLVSAFLLAIGLASKVTALFFILPVALASIASWIREKRKEIWLVKIGSLIILTLIFFFIFCPYYFLNWPEALRILIYESKLASGQLTAFYTRQFWLTKPLVFQLQRIFPWVLGWPLFILGIWGLILNIFLLIKRKIKKQWWLFHLGWWPYFLFNIFLYTKWVRFMIPVLPFWVILAFWRITRITKKELAYFMVLISLIPGLIFSKIYWTTDIRLRATDWINQNLAPNSVILFENGNIVDLPSLDQNKFTTIGFNFYTLEESFGQQEKLTSYLAKADYFLSPSRRVFANLQQQKLPYTQDFYQDLLSGKSGFSLIREFNLFSRWERLVVGSDLNSEETWTVFDHPTLRLYQKHEN